MVIAYKKEKWDDSNYQPLDDETYSDDETYNPTYKDGKIVFKLDSKTKKDDDDEKDENKCKETKLYLTLTNKLNPKKPKSTLAEMRLGSALTQVSDSGSQDIALVQAGAVGSGSIFNAVKYFISFVMMSSLFLF
jgi:hypothetical protein